MRALKLLAVLSLAACTTQAPTEPAAPAAPEPAVVAPAPKASAASEALAARYAQMQANLLRDGLLRTDGGGQDTPFTDRMLADAFLSVAFYEEYAGGEVTNHSRAAIPLQRWTQPVRVGLKIGASVPAETAAADRATVASYLARLSRLTGLQIALDDRRPNFFLHIASLDERAALGPQIAAEMPGLTPGQLASATHLSDEAFCQVLSQTDDATQTYSRAVAVIPSEHPALLLQACLHEEIAQALGLPNDSNLARPSIFNDDQEFALLTRMDELMLRMLYSPSLRPGMSAEAARPVVQDLASRLVDGEI